MYHDVFGNPVAPLKSLTDNDLAKLFLVRCSSIKEFNSKGRGKTEMWGETAKGVILQIASEICYGMNIDQKAYKNTAKGLILEDDSIELVNRVYFENYHKNDIRKSNGVITGCPDIIDFHQSLIIDIKSSYTIDTFAKERFGKGEDYTSQLRGYMWLFEIDRACTAHTLLNTPKSLWKFGDTATMHNYDHIPAEDRVIIDNVVYRDITWEEELKNRHAEGLEIFMQYIDDFKNKGRELPPPMPKPQEQPEEEMLPVAA